MATDDLQQSLNELSATIDKVMTRKAKLEALADAVRTVVRSGKVISSSDPVTDDDWLGIIDRLIALDGYAQSSRTSEITGV